MTRIYEYGVFLDLTEEQWAKVEEIKKRPPEQRTSGRLKAHLFGTDKLVFDVSVYSGGGEVIKEDR